MKKSFLASIAIISLSFTCSTTVVNAQDKSQKKQEDKQLVVTGTLQEWNTRVAYLQAIENFLGSDEAQELRLKSANFIKIAVDTNLKFIVTQLNEQLKGAQPK